MSGIVQFNTLAVYCSFFQYYCSHLCVCKHCKSAGEAEELARYRKLLKNHLKKLPALQSSNVGTLLCKETIQKVERNVVGRSRRGHGCFQTTTRLRTNACKNTRQSRSSSHRVSTPRSAKRSWIQFRVRIHEVCADSNNERSEKVK